MRKRTYKVLFVIVVIVLGVYILNDFLEVIQINRYMGVSNGLPYCLNCFAISTSLPIYKEGMMAVHYLHGDSVAHRIISIDENNVTFASNIDNNYTIERDMIESTYLLEFEFKTTDNFREACEHELKTTGYLLAEGICELLWNYTFCPEKETYEGCWLTTQYPDNHTECREYKTFEGCKLSYYEL